MKKPAGTSTQVTRLLGDVKKQYDSFMKSAARATDVAHQRKYLRAAEQTVAAAEKVIAQLKTGIAAAKILLPEATRPAARRKAATRLKRKSVKKRL